MNACGGTCFRGLCAQRNVIPSVKLISTPLCSPTSHPFGEATYSMEMPSFVDDDSMDEAKVKCPTPYTSCDEDVDYTDVDDNTDDDKLVEGKAESRRSVVVPDINNSPSFAARIYAARMQAEKDLLTCDCSDVLNTTASSACKVLENTKALRSCANR